MRKRPKGSRFRNLYAVGRVIYVQRRVNGRHIHFSTRTDDWDLAAAVRDRFEAERQIGVGVYLPRTMPTFREFSDRYLTEDMGHLAPGTKHGRRLELAPTGRIGSFFCDLPLDQITSNHIREWWGREVERKGRSTKTGRNDLNAVAAVLGFARELGIIDTDPVGSFREVLRRKSRTQRGRAETDPARHIRPIEQPQEIDRLVHEAEKESPEAHVLVLLCLDAGLRLGEALGLRWGHIIWGEDENDRARALLVQESRQRQRGRLSGPTKSGRERRVAMSRRLRRALRERYRTLFGPSPETHVLPKVRPDNFRHRDWRRILNRAGIGHRRIKDLRDTFASQLLTAGVQLGYVSAQLGHADVGVTARHYARWAGGDSYREPMVLQADELPADLLARLRGALEATADPETLIGPHSARSRLRTLR